MNAISIRSIVVIISLSLFIVGSTDYSANAQELAKEQVVVIGNHAGDIGTIDPMVSVVVQDRIVSHHVFGALVRHPVGNIAAGVEPDLATKWEVSSDGLAWTFHLRRGVKWHWGYGEVTSEDVVFSLNRVKESKGSAWSTNYKNFKDIKAIDEYTVQITTFNPENLLLNRVANYFGGFIVCKKAAQKTGNYDQAMSPTKEQIVGTGPFKFLEYKPKDSIVLVRNDDYWEGKPIIEKIIAKYIPDDGAREIALLNGEIAACKGIENDKWIKYMRSKGKIIDVLGPPDLKTLYFNSKIKPFDDKRVRQAFAYCASQESIMQMQGKEISRIATSPVPSDTFGHIDAGWAEYKRNPEKAKKLLAEAGYPNGLTVRCFMSEGQWLLDKMIIWQSELKECGINVEMTKLDHGAYKSTNRRDVNSLIMWGDRLVFPTYWLRDRYHGASMMSSPTAANNYANYSNPKVDRLIELAESSLEKKVQLDALAKAQRIIVEDLPAIPVIETMLINVRNPWLDLGYKVMGNACFHYEIGLKTKILKR